MCTTTDEEVMGDSYRSSNNVPTKVAAATFAFAGVVTIAALATAISVAVSAVDVAQSSTTSAAATIPVPAPTMPAPTYAPKKDTAKDTTMDKPTEEESPVPEPVILEIFSAAKGPAVANPCAGKKVDLPNVECVVGAIGPQAGANVTKGFKGLMNVTYEPIKTPYFQNDMCPVNVHWHLGTEHLSVGEFDETGKGPTAEDGVHRALAAGEDVRGGFRCHHYNKDDTKFTTEYEWKHCVGMKVGETYEVHWPHSAAGECGTVNQYQTPFYDGVLCNIEVLGDLSRLPQQVGVQGQVFTIVNDESYYYPDLMRGMIVDGNEKGADIAKYTGSTTGTSRNNEICSSYSPITWQVDRKCHMISASSFDKMCADMKSQNDDMSDDLYAHGSRELVVADFVANNQHDRKLRGAAN